MREYIHNVYRIFETIEELAVEHAKIFDQLESELNELRKNPKNENLYNNILRRTKKLRAIRARLKRALRKLNDVSSANHEAKVLQDIATLSEYMVIVGFYQERALLEELAEMSREANLPHHQTMFEEDLRELDDLTRMLETIIDKYY
ncbi:MAG: hypothetical protein ABWW70_07760 [Thermoproteota archaeon]